MLRSSAQKDQKRQLQPHRCPQRIPGYRAPGPSVFDGTVRPITIDVAPYVRSIVAYDARLQKQRLKLSNLISEGGRGPKRMRTTRAAMSALEGGSRSATRKEKWFSADLNTALVLRTGGE